MIEGRNWHHEKVQRTGEPMGIKFKIKRSYQMGQRYAKHQVQSGIRVYHQRHYQLALGRWRSALNRLKSAEDRFVTLGYMAQAFCDSSDYESMLHYALQQMELANSRNDDFMKCEAFLNLSKAYERLADFGKAILYGNASLQRPSIDARTPGYSHLGVALAQLGLSKFQSSLEEFEKAMGIANDTGDKLLELQICVGLGALFTLLKDLNKAIIFLRNALTILQLITVDNVHAKYKSTILFHLSVVLRLKGSLSDAHNACEEALILSFQTTNRSIYARALCSMTDINRELGETEAKETITKSWARYEKSFRIMRQINDRMGEVVVLGSMAKSASESRTHYTGQCECQAIQLNKKCLELATMIGCKHSMMECHLRLQELYAQLADEDSEESAAKSYTLLIQEMELFCNFCGQQYGNQDNSLQALSCSHIFHEKCLHKFLLECQNPSCPKCQRKAIVMEIKSQASNSSKDEIKTKVEMNDNAKTIYNAEKKENTNNRTATLTKKRPNFECFNQQIFSQNQQQIEIPTVLKHQNYDNTKLYHQKMTFPPSFEYSKYEQNIKAHATIRLPKTNSVPLPDFSDTIFVSNKQSSMYDAKDLNLPINLSPSITKTVSTSSAIPIKHNNSYFDFVPLLSSTAPESSNGLNTYLPFEISSDFPMQQFTLFSSTNATAFYPSNSENTLSYNTSIKGLNGMSSGSGGDLTSTQASSKTNQPPMFFEQSQKRLPSREENLCLTNQSKKSLLNHQSTCSEQDELKLSHNKANELVFVNPKLNHSTISSTPQDQPDHPLNSILNEKTFIQQSTSQKILIDELNLKLTESTDVNKKIKPPPPPLRKLCCTANAFPILSDELINTKVNMPSKYSIMLERAMCPVLTENEITLNGDIGCATTTIASSAKLGKSCLEKDKCNKTNNKTFVVYCGPGVTDV